MGLTCPGRPGGGGSGATGVGGGSPHRLRRRVPRGIDDQIPEMSTGDIKKKNK